MILTEILNRPNDRKTFYFMGRNIPYWVYNAYCAIGMFAFGGACSQLTTDVMKYTVGTSNLFCLIDSSYCDSYTFFRKTETPFLHHLFAKHQLLAA